MRRLSLALGAIAVASVSLVNAADAAYVSKCKRPMKWNAVEAKCEIPPKKAAMKKPVAKKPS